MRDWSDAELVTAALDARRRRSSDLRAVEELVRRHQGMVTANCRFMLGEGGDVDDVAQDVFVKAYASVSRLEDRSRFGAWLKRIKANRCIDLIRQRRARPQVDVEDAGLAEHEADLRVLPNVVDDLDRRRTIAIVREVVDSLDDTYRIPLVLADLDGLPYAEIASHLGIGISATKMRIARAREMFRERYADRTCAPSAQDDDRSEQEAS